MKNLIRIISLSAVAAVAVATLAGFGPFGAQPAFLLATVAVAVVLEIGLQSCCPQHDWNAEAITARRLRHASTSPVQLTQPEELREVA